MSFSAHLLPAWRKPLTKTGVSARRKPALNLARLFRFQQFLAFFFIATLAVPVAQADTFRVATYNIENYLNEATDTRPAKSPESKAKVCENIVTLKPDVLALQEMGDLKAFEELRATLFAKGLDLPFWTHVTGFDTNIHVAVLSKFPFRSVHAHTNDSYLLDGRRFRVSRGFAEVEIGVKTNYTFTLITAHLKSKRPIGIADADEMRLEEAKVLREKVDGVFAANAQARLVVLGDFNDTPDAKSTKGIIGRGKHKMVDTRPTERNGDELAADHRGQPPRSVAWTHFYAVQDTYSRLDYILLSPVMAHDWVTNQTFVLTVPNWGLASDHRPILATFDTGE
jgi:endonuclease/exonuclease/phosphatase family metal-dependent hydrolase